MQLTHIKDSNIESAVKACQGESGKHLHNQERVEMVKESLNDNYCDVSGRGGDLSLIGETSQRNQTVF